MNPPSISTFKDFMHDKEFFLSFFSQISTNLYSLVQATSKRMEISVKVAQLHINIFYLFNSRSC